jgi:arylsulfatase A-like enzyme
MIWASSCDRRLVVSILTASVLLSTACADRAPAPPVAPQGGASPTALLVITLDTTRADRIGAYGHRTARTPNIDGLADRGVLFEQALTPAPLTVPAHASLMTGYQPPHHGVRTNDDVLQDEPNLTLAEILRERGFRTGAFLGAAVLHRWSGLDQGFETYGDDFPLDSSPFDSFYAEKRAAEVVAAALGWLSEVGDEPFFLWVHLFDPHAPYQPPGEFAAEFRDRPYDGEIAYGDEQIGVLLEALGRLGLRDRTLIMFLSDHGEGLGEHREGSHGFFIYDSTVRIPFIISCPSVLPQRLRVTSQVQIVDFMPTALAILGADQGIETGGRNLSSLVAGEEIEEVAIYGETRYPLATHGWSPLASLRREGFKVIRAPTPELYDLNRDPSEARNLFEGGDRETRMLSELADLESEISRTLEPRTELIDPQRLEALEALGYVGSSAAAPEPEGSLPDPKERVDTILEFEQALDLLNRRRTREALTLLEELARREPNSASIHEVLGGTLLSAQQLGDARKIFERLLVLKPGDGKVLMNLGLLAISAREMDAAVAYLEQAHAARPDDPLVLLNLGQLYYHVRGDHERGRPYLERFVELAPEDRAAPDIRKLLERAE